MAEALGDAAAARSLLHHHPAVPEVGPVTLPVLSVSLAAARPSKPAPRAGEHSDAILTDLSYSWGEVAAMR